MCLERVVGCTILFSGNILGDHPGSCEGSFAAADSICALDSAFASTQSHSFAYTCTMLFACRLSCGHTEPQGTAAPHDPADGVQEEQRSNGSGEDQGTERGVSDVNSTAVKAAQGSHFLASVVNVAFTYEILISFCAAAEILRASITSQGVSLVSGIPACSCRHMPRLPASRKHGDSETAQSEQPELKVEHLNFHYITFSFRMRRCPFPCQGNPGTLQLPGSRIWQASRSKNAFFLCWYACGSTYCTRGESINDVFSNTFGV